jgi:disulfide bond formation protein DsbB
MFKTSESRTYFGILFFYCLFLLGTAFFLQYYLELAPCLFCLIDRALVISLIVIYGLAFLHNPSPRGVTVYCTLGGICALLGMATTIRHLWLLNAPVNPLEGCSPGLEYLLSTLPLKDVFLSIIQSAPECSADTGHFFGLSIPAWTMIGFTLVALGNWLPWWASRKSNG